MGGRGGGAERLSSLPMYDERYKTIFASPRMVEDLLRGFAARRWAGELDFTALRKLSADYVSDNRLRRHGDNVWQVRFRDGRALLLVLEFQSSNDQRMALRILVYTSLLYQELLRNKAPGLDERGRLPLVLPVVLYNGEAPWRAPREVIDLIQPADEGLAPYRPSQRHLILDERNIRLRDLPRCNLVTAVARLEQMRSPGDIVRVVRILRRRLRRAEDGELRRAFAAWVWETAKPFLPPGEALPPEMTLEKIEMTLAERAAEWSNQWVRQGLEKGIEQGLEQGLERGLERGLEQGLERGIEQGLERGITQGLEQGLAHERALLRRMAASRFGVDTAERLSDALADATNPERLAEVGEWLVRCETGHEFLARVALTPGAEAGRDDA